MYEQLHKGVLFVLVCWVDWSFVIYGEESENEVLMPFLVGYDTKRLIRVWFGLSAL